MAIKQHTASDNGSNLMIVAGPGTGKSSTMIDGLKYVFGGGSYIPNFPPTDQQRDIFEAMSGSYRSIVFLSFNKSIAQENNQKVPQGVDCRTFHSYVIRYCWKKQGVKFNIDNDATRWRIHDRVLGLRYRQKLDRDQRKNITAANKLVGVIKNNMADWNDLNVLEMLASKHSIDMNGSRAEVFNMAQQCMDTYKSFEEDDMANGGTVKIDFDDVLFLPQLLNWDCEKVDLMIVDETQDTNGIQRYYFQFAGRVIAVGDPNQSIYAFRGADYNSMEILGDHLTESKKGMKTLPLNISWRLPKTHVDNANQIRPDSVQAAPNAIEGTIINGTMKHWENGFSSKDDVQSLVGTDLFSGEGIVPGLTPGDLGLARLNASLCLIAHKLIKLRVPVKIQGSDFGKGLIYLIKSICDRNTRMSISEFSERLASHHVKERERIQKYNKFPELPLSALDEKIDSIAFLTEGLDTVQDVINSIEELFSDEKVGGKFVLLSTVHRAKGLEADRVWIFNREKMPHPLAQTHEDQEQEQNIIFVAETRAKNTLIRLYSDGDDE